MHLDDKIKSRVTTIAIDRDFSWIWIALLISTFAILVLGLSACGLAPAATDEKIANLPDTITVDEAYEKYQDGIFFLDVRTTEEWEEYHAPDTTLIPLNELENRLNELPEGEEIVVICRSGNRSQAGRDILRSNGFEMSTSMDGGLNAWRAAGYPIE